MSWTGHGVGIGSRGAKGLVQDMTKWGREWRSKYSSLKI